MELKGYKGFDKDLKCRDFQYEVGKEYKYEGNIELCKSGFHFCKKMIDIHYYYNLKNGTIRVCEVIASGNIIEDENKCVTDTIKIIKELSENEIEELKNIGNKNKGLGNTGDWNAGDCNTGNCNTGNCNTGNCNTGNRNTGDCNTGDRNTGDCNTGDWNTGNCNTGYKNAGNCNAGDWNTGDRNTGNRNTGHYNTGYKNAGNRNAGDCNTGDRNTGYWNTGDWNTGNCNTGDWNTGNCNTGDWNIINRSTGCFCTKKQKLKFFDENVDITWKEWRQSDAYYILNRISQIRYVTWEEMTEEEQKENPGAKKTGGFLRRLNLKEEAEKWWDSLTDKEKEIIRNIPNYNKTKFRKIMGGAEIG